ncbi:MAG: hypothetical protein FGM52_00175 [Mycobacterium sp.]|nr:hypothetical protein [Mycobacterium sp.]
MSADTGAGYQTVFRESWRERQSAGNRLGDLIRQPGWLDAGLVGLGVLLAAGAVAAGTVTVARTAAYPAVVDGTTVSAVRGSGPTPAVGSPAQFRDTSAAEIGATVVSVSATEVVARLSRPASESAGQLLVPLGRERLLDLLAPRIR